LPAAAGNYSICLTASDTVRCLIEEVEFARERNTEVDASIARVARARAFEAARNAEIAASIARVQAVRTRQLEIKQNALVSASIAASNVERERRFAARQNELATASVNRVEIERNRQRAASLSPCKSLDDSRPRCEAQRARESAAQQNALATASVQRVNAARERAFAAARNAEIEASIAAVARNRAPNFAYNISHCAQIDTTPRCEAERNRELQASLSHCKSDNDTSPRCVREFQIARNAEIERSLAAVARERATRYANLTSITTASVEKPATLSAAEYAALTSHCVRVPASPRCEAERIREFAAVRNAEIERSIAAVEAERARREAANPDNGNASSLETGTISIPVNPSYEKRSLFNDEFRHDISTAPCRLSGTPFGPLHFAIGAEIENAMRPELDRLADLAHSCSGMRIEVHGYSDGSGSAFTNRSMAQARAQAIADYLVGMGVPPNRVAAIGRGAMEPVLPYSKGIDRAYGRRVEFVIRDPAINAAARQVMWDLAELLDPTFVPAVAGLSP
jgi:flagellar motor protein MotB